MDWPLHFEAGGPVDAAPGPLFDHLDDPHRLSAHMERSSMAMLGTRMTLQCDERGGRAIGSRIRMDGALLGLRLQLAEVVTEHRPPALKAWETQGVPRLLVISGYRMGFRIAPEGAGSHLSVFIDYRLPGAGPSRWLGQVLGPAYARWCCRQMLRDAQHAFAPAAAAAPHRP